MDKFMQLTQTKDQAAAMQLIASISATDPSCGSCLQSVAGAAANDPSKLLTCADSAAAPTMRAMVGLTSGMPMVQQTTQQSGEQILRPAPYS